MISIKRSNDGYEELRQLLAIVGKAISGTLDAVGHYAVKTDAESLRRLRTNLACLHDQLRAHADQPKDEILSAVSAGLRAVLPEYCVGPNAFIETLSSGLAGLSEALSIMRFKSRGNLGSVEKQMQNETAALAFAVQLPNLKLVRESSIRYGLRCMTSRGDTWTPISIRRHNDVAECSSGDIAGTKGSAHEESLKSSDQPADEEIG